MSSFKNCQNLVSIFLKKIIGNNLLCKLIVQNFTRNSLSMQMIKNVLILTMSQVLRSFGTITVLQFLLFSTQEKGFPVSMLKGGECTCESFVTFKLQKRPDANCNVPCPLSSMVDPDVVPPTPSSSCGGNQQYSVYCNKTGQFDCDTLPVDNGGDPTLSVGNHVGNGDDFLVKNMEGYPFCGRCDLATSCMGGTGAITPSYDYFPKNEPYSCRAFCRKEQRFVIIRLKA